MGCPSIRPRSRPERKHVSILVTVMCLTCVMVKTQQSSAPTPKQSLSRPLPALLPAPPPLPWPAPISQSPPLPTLFAPLAPSPSRRISQANCPPLCHSRQRVSQGKLRNISAFGFFFFFFFLLFSLSFLAFSLLHIKMPSGICSST